MKLIFTSLFLIAATCFAQTDTRWESRMLQIQIGGAVGIPELVADQGTKTSLPVGQNGSRFELWGYKYSAGVIVDQRLLAPTEVNTYKPILEDISIESSDPYPSTPPRTRFDKPFNVHVKLSGLLADGPDVPLAAQCVEIEHYVDLYPNGSYDGKTIESSRLHAVYSIRKNTIDQHGRAVIPFSVSNLTVANGIAAIRAGRERFKVFVLQDDKSPRRQLGEEVTIAIFPITEANISGLNTDLKYRTIPDFSYSVVRGYPDSKTWIEMYEGEYVAGRRGTQIALYNHGSLTPSSTDGRVNGVGIVPQPTTNGPLTFVINTSAPFPGETFAEGGKKKGHVTINFENTITVNSMISTTE